MLIPSWAQYMLMMKIDLMAMILAIRGGVKKTVFLTFGQKGEGVSVNPKNPYQKILRFFFTNFDRF